MAGDDQAWAELEREVDGCTLCPRLRLYGDEVSRSKRKAFAEATYWGRPVPSFGDRRAPLLLVGLAPAAHGAHRTGRMFTGDRSGDFLYAALHRGGLASAGASRDRDDGLELRGVYITAAARCAPPGNRPTGEEFTNCRPYLARELDLLRHLKVVISLGQLAHEQVFTLLQTQGKIGRRSDYRFAHGAEHHAGGLLLLDCYHPSQQNTFTGRLTPEMLDAVLARAKKDAAI